jgi:hypothetical protein
VLSDDPSGVRPLARIFASTDQISATKNRANFFWQAAPLVCKKLQDLHRFGERGLEDDGSVGAPTWSAHSNRIYTVPRPVEMGRLAAALLGRYVRAKARSLRYDPQWFIAYELAEGAADLHADVADVPARDPSGFRTLMPPRGLGWADPFPVYDAGRHYVFFEEFGLRGEPHGRICVVEIDAEGTPGEPVPVLERDYHLSYPFVFAHEGTWYMVPETESRDAVELYRATRFPHEWAFDRTLVEAPSPADATIAEIGGRWWMFVATRVPEVHEWSQLAIYHAPSPLGPWSPHPRNPVRTDARNVRPAGRIFRYEGAYYRPAQDGTPVYGSATVVNRIDQLDLTTFRETPVARIEPRWRPGLTGTHTLNAAGGLTAIDARHWQRR